MLHLGAKTLKGEVVSASMKKTVVVSVGRYVQHPKYKKYMRTTKRYKAHDEKGEYKVGDKVLIRECRPLSKEKRFVVIGKY
ncbi:MAG: 30S ribosomal protein S17 [Candidatus Niyogibacteria bacterium]|nr:30S ribosomal protein S17 [Candidatus Niyogibacteria bacterium]